MKYCHSNTISEGIRRIRSNDSNDSNDSYKRTDFRLQEGSSVILGVRYLHPFKRCNMKRSYDISFFFSGWRDLI